LSKKDLEISKTGGGGGGKRDRGEIRGAVEKPFREKSRKVLPEGRTPW